MYKGQEKLGLVYDPISEKIQGERRLSEEDRIHSRNAKIERNILSYSLFGSEPGYCECMYLNILESSKTYPGWEVVVYHDDTVPPYVLERFSSKGAILVNVLELGIAHWPGTFWRFAAVSIQNANLICFRDADSIVCNRERVLVDSWQKSSLPFHIIRDWYTHSDLILAGLWGAKAALLNCLPDWIETYLKNKKKLHATHEDQIFLAEKVWPIIKDYSLVHDSIHDIEGVVKFENNDLSRDGRYSLGGFLVKKMMIDIGAKLNTKYEFSIVSNNNEQVCHYLRTLKDGKDEFTMPTKYFENIESNTWFMKVNIIT